MRILMVGCGAVGQVLALHLVESGARLAFYARPRSAAQLRKALSGGGLTLSQISHFRKHPGVRRLRDYDVVEDVASSQAFVPDQIWFTTPSSVYHSEWFRDFLRHVPSQQVVCFPPEGKRPDMVASGVSEDRFVFGGITFVAWQGDLDGGGGRPDDVSFWFPPGLSIPLMGSERACADVVALLAGAGIRSDVKGSNYGTVQAAVTAVMTTFVAGLELAGWSLKAFRKSAWHRCAAHGAREAVLSQLPRAGLVTKTLLRIPISALGFALATLLLPVVLPVDAEAYLRFHFLKTREQTLALLDLFERDGELRRLQMPHMQSLRAALLDRSATG